MKRIDMDINVKEREVRSLASISAHLSKIKKTDKAPVQQQVYDFSRKFGRLTAAQAEKLISELDGLEIARMTKEHMISITDVLPRNDLELKLIFAASKTTIKPEDLARILDIVKKHA